MPGYRHYFFYRAPAHLRAIIPSPMRSTRTDDIQITEGSSLISRKLAVQTFVAGAILIIARLAMSMAITHRRTPDATGCLTALGALFLCVAQMPSTRADSASCVAKVSSYVVELDELLSKERNWITPYFDLDERYLPFRDCEADALLEVVSRSRFIQPIDSNPRLKEYFIVFSSDEVRVGFSYQASEKKSDRGHSGWVHK